MKRILDACCGSRMFWFDKEDKRVLFQDKRKTKDKLCDGRFLEIDPDVVGDFTKMEFKDNTFNLVVFDPPHLIRVGKKSWMAKKYGSLTDNWRYDLSKGFNECFRVLKNGGVLIFKWNERDIKVSDVLNLTENKPLFGHKTRHNGQTIWIAFMKA